MAEIELSIEGQGALEATQELVEIPGLTGIWYPDGDTDPSKDVMMTTIVTIVGIAGGAMGIAEQIRKWYQEWKKGKEGKTIKKVTLRAPDSSQIILEEITTEQIVNVLKKLSAE